jgi:hypothetical protein
VSLGSSGISSSVFDVSEGAEVIAVSLTSLKALELRAASEITIATKESKNEK